MIYKPHITSKIQAQNGIEAKSIIAFLRCDYKVWSHVEFLPRSISIFISMSTTASNVYHLFNPISCGFSLDSLQRL
jgi:hypothetical protein